MRDNVSRKDFVALIGTTVAVETLPASSVAKAATPSNHRLRPRRSRPNPKPTRISPPPESAFVEAAVERLIPMDELGPGGREAGIAFYIDQQLSGQFGYAAKMCRRGPWVPDAPANFGYKLPLTPRDVYRLGIAATNAHCTATYSKLKRRR